MKTVTLRELRSRYTSVVKWIEAGEEVKISQDGKIVARFVPEKPKRKNKIKRLTRPRARADKIKPSLITAEQRAALFDE
jgi:antitoxin (DNA-binding transcriptional repressor) of toxin-antitoxin stability system